MSLFEPLILKQNQTTENTLNVNYKTKVKTQQK